jgi:hypothetical protein
MIDPKQIPDAVVQAACLSRYGKKWHLFTQHCKVIERDMARAAITAAINAWPGLEFCWRPKYRVQLPGYKKAAEPVYIEPQADKCILLPLPAPEEKP